MTNNSYRIELACILLYRCAKAPKGVTDNDVRKQFREKYGCNPDNISSAFFAKEFSKIAEPPQSDSGWGKRKSKKPRKNKYGRPFGFYDTDKWLELRLVVLGLYGRKCMKCETTEAKIHVDHIKPRSKHPNLELDIANLQVLCEACNMEKLNLNETDYRTQEQRFDLLDYLAGRGNFQVAETWE